jgi:DNA-binding PadR family transcriptional regulator
MGRALGGFEQTILLALLRLGAGADGVSIRREIESRTGQEISTGALYTTLERLDARGLVSHELGEATPVRGGRRKKAYALEEAGLLALRESYDTFSVMVRGVEAQLDVTGEPETP